MACGGQSSPQGSMPTYSMHNSQCSSCLQVFRSSSIKRLPVCDHAFCRDCLVSLTNGANSFECPTCQVTVKLKEAGPAGVDALAGFVMSRKLGSNWGKKSTEKSSPDMGLQRVKALTEVSGGSMSTKHRAEELSFFCPPCDVIVWDERLKKDHATHGVTSLEKTLQEQSTRAKEVSEEAKRKMKQIRRKLTELQSTKEGLAAEESNQVKAVEEAAQKAVSAFSSGVTNRTGVLKEQIHNFFASNEQMILDRQGELQDKVTQLEDCIEALERCVNQDEAIAVFSGRKMLKDLIEQSAQPNRDIHTTTVFIPTSYQSLSFSVGKVHVTERKQMVKNKDVQLHKSENPWRRRKRAPEWVVQNAIFREMRGILNKLTPQKFQTLCQQVLDLDIVTEGRLKGVIDLVFENATTVEKYSAAYANICRCLIHLTVPMKDNPRQTVNFRKLLLNRCQREFEKDKDDEPERGERMRKIKQAEDDAERKMLETELEQEMTKARRRALGNIRFIGELFKVKMLKENTMHDCVVKLLKSNDEESLECLCRLLTTIGKDLDFDKAKPRMDQYFREIDKIFKQRRTSPRVRFKLQDVLELRENNWVPRRDDNKPKTIDQIHKEAELEIQQQNLKLKVDRRGQDKKQMDAGKDPQQPQDDRPKPQEGGAGSPAAAKPKKIKKKTKKEN